MRRSLGSREWVRGQCLETNLRATQRLLELRAAVSIDCDSVDQAASWAPEKSPKKSLKTQQDGGEIDGDNEDDNDMEEEDEEAEDDEEQGLQMALEWQNDSRLLKKVEAEVNNTSMEKLLKQWASLRCNSLTAVEAGHKKGNRARPSVRIHDYSSDWTDMSTLSMLMCSLTPYGTDTGTTTLDPGRRFSKVMEAALTLDPQMKESLTYKDIIQGEGDKLAAFVGQLFATTSGPTKFKPKTHASICWEEVTHLTAEVRQMREDWDNMLARLFTLCEAEDHLLTVDGDEDVSPADYIPKLPASFDKSVATIGVRQNFCPLSNALSRPFPGVQCYLHRRVVSAGHAHVTSF
ncbi:hypothetical protein CYMTET_45130 [Cymbomonas tetramitiformis]|uniref:Uncharacterized protein n=1 Tax=Cymbomonas tetramitiformis TaxID=36881 RepID=A0AAE0BYU4_9CHLO|nr:hypothetical protein CYMTET_45130 [Cymbomonas tetramitiformis]